MSEIWSDGPSLVELDAYGCYADEYHQSSFVIRRRCALANPQGYGCWLQDGHDGDCEPDASRLGAVSGIGPSCTRCGQPLTRWPSDTWADTGGMVVCPAGGGYRAHSVGGHP